MSFEPGEFLTVISGDNGQGKTNLLESVWLLSGAKSFRGSKDGELIKNGCSSAHIKGEVDGDGDKKVFEIAIYGEGAEKKGRYAKINGVDYGRASGIAGRFFAVVFAPSHLNLIKGSPDVRRRFLDAALCQLYPKYINLHSRYTRALMQKNILLKRTRTHAFVVDQLDAFDKDIIECGFEIVRRRREYVTRLKPFIEKNYNSISNGAENILVRYMNDTADINAFAKGVQQARTQDLYAGFSTFGPHRDDIELLLNGADAKVYASQGQQRSAVLSIKLAEAEQILDVAGANPVMLLDDVLSELDGRRQEFLLSKIENKQVLITGCDPKLFGSHTGKHIVISGGEIVQQYSGA